MLRIENVSFAYSKKRILDDVSLSITKGEFVAILGSNGAGKSTLMKIASSYLKPQSGRVFINGKDVSTIPPNKLAKERAVLEQDSSLEFNYTVLDTVCLGRFALSSFWGIDKKTKDIALQALKDVGLDGFENKQYLELSGGEKRRVQLARVIAQIRDNPDGKILMLDEPTANLDPKYTYETMQACENLRKQGATCIAVVHSLELAMRYADKVALIKNGKILAFGATSEVITEANVSELYSIHCKITSTPFSIQYLQKLEERV